MRGRLADVRFDRDGDVVVASVAGEVDSSNARELLSALSAGVPAEARGMALDVSELRYLDSAGIEMVFSLGTRLRNRRQRLALALPDEAPVGRVLGLSGVESVATVAGDVAAAVEAMTGGQV